MIFRFLRHMIGIPLLPLLASQLAMPHLGCSPGSERDARSSDRGGPARRGGRLVIGVQQEPDRLCEILSATAVNGLVGGLIFSRFVKYDDELRLIPDLIEEIPTVENGGVSEDRLTYTYHLRRNARWHDGAPVTSADVRFTVDIITDPDVHAESRDGWDVIESVATPDSHTVVFHLKRAYPSFVSDTFYEEPVLPKHLLDHERGERFNGSHFHQAPVGSGPFVFKEWRRGEYLAVEANDSYYGDGPYLDEVIVRFAPDENALLVLLQSGEIDVYDNASIGQIAQIENAGNFTVHKTPTLMYEHLDLNTENDILSDKRVRQAIAYATNKAMIADVVYEGFAEVAPLDEHPSSKYFSRSAAALARFDPVQARRLLRDAGWADTDGDGILDKDGRKLSLTISATSGNQNRERTEVVLRDQLREVGIDLDIRNYTPTVLYGAFDDGGILKRGRFDIAMYAWLSSPEPASKDALYSPQAIPPNGQNHPRFRNERLGELLERGASEWREDERVRIYGEISAILVEEAPVIPLFWYENIDVATSRLHNYRPNPTQSGDSWNAASWYLADEAALRGTDSAR